MDADSPPFDRSQLDGFAVIAAEARQGAELQLLGMVDAGGTLFSGQLTPGKTQCVGINTGGVMPTGADAVLMVELTQRIDREGRPYIRVKKDVTPRPGHPAAAQMPA